MTDNNTDILNKPKKEKEGTYQPTVIDLPMQNEKTLRKKLKTKSHCYKKSWELFYVFALSGYLSFFLFWGGGGW